MGIDPKTVKNGGNSLINGLMTLKTAELDGFAPSSFDNEQGLRGLVAWRLSQAGKRIFDFSAYPKNAAYATRKSGGQSGGSVKTDKEEKTGKISVTVTVMTHNGNDCNNSYTYKSDSAKYSELISETVEMEADRTVYDATVAALEKNGISYEDRGGYFAEIGNISEFDHGSNSGWMFKVNGKHQNSGAMDIVLTKDSRVLWFYTDDYTKESGSESFQNGVGGKSDKPDTENDGEQGEDTVETPQKRTFTPSTFSDVKETDWHYTAVKYVYENNLMQGTDKGFEPDAKMTRAMLVNVLFRLSGEERTVSGKAFSDVVSGAWYEDGILWAASVGIVSGIGESLFAPDAEITREQMAVILYNFALYKNGTANSRENEKITEFEDYSEVSDYAKAAISWANAEGFISGESETELNPKNSATRAQIASLLMRYCEAE